MKIVSRWLMAVAAAAFLAGCAAEEPEVEENEAPETGQTGALSPGQPPGTPLPNTGGAQPFTPPAGD